MNIDPDLRAQAISEAQAILRDVAGVSAVIVATADGFEIASASQRTLDPARMAAMASSIAAIGAVVAREARLGRCRGVTVDTDDGFALISPVRRRDLELVIHVIASGTAVLAQALHRTGRCVRALEASQPAAAT